MPNPFEQVKVGLSQGRYYHHMLPSYHVTTQDFFCIRPVFYKEMPKGESIRVSHSNFARLMPLKQPFLGGCKIVNRAYFVPYRTIFPYFNDFIVDNTSVDEDGVIKVNQMPWLYNKDIVDIFVDYYANSTTTAAYDFVRGSTKYRFTNAGRKVYNILCSLGISIDFTYIDSNDLGVPIAMQQVLAFIKIYCDWYTAPQYDVIRHELEVFIHSMRRGGRVNDTNKWRALFNLLEDMSLYDADYFSSAFDNPQVPSQGTVSSVQIPELKGYDKSVLQPSPAADAFSRSKTGDSRVIFDVSDSKMSPPYIEGMSSEGGSSSAALNNAYAYRGFVTMLNQYMLDSLKALTDYVRRFQLVGSRTIDRYFAMFGVELDEAKLNRSIYLGKSESIVQISDVMATAETNVTTTSADVQHTGIVPLGDYAGKGISFQDNGSYSYKTDEYGVFMVLSTIIPKIGYVQGVNRYNLHIDRLDFFSGDFEAQCIQAIARAELFNDGKTSAEQTNRPQGTERSGVFGYNKIYSEYVTPNNWLSGDFRLGTRNADLQSWHLFRMFHPDTEEGWNFINHHSEAFLTADNAQYDRIFNYDESDYDHFVVAHQFDVEVVNQCKPVFDLYHFDDKREVMVRLNGTNHN